MRRKHSKLRMGFRGRSGLLGCVVCGSAVLVVLYYAWNSYFGSPSKVSFSSVQGLAPGQLEQWDKERQLGPVIEDPPIGLNKEIEMQMANEKWKKAKALQDRIDEERLAEEQAAEAHGKKIDNILKTKMAGQDSGKNQEETVERGQKISHPLLFKQADPLDGDYFSKLERIVHLDLKGAPPLVSYLEKLFPVLKNMGATGLLMEYEDMFPYSGNLSRLASASAYSLSDLQRIHTAAELSGLEIIPLVQTFGHMEFVLKLKEFAGLREHDYTPQVITPVRQESYTLILSMLEQVLKAHPKARRIHLGCDEVYGLGQGQSHTYVTSNRLTPEALFLQHVVKMARHLKTAFPAVQSLIWDDWLRKTQYEDLADSGLANLVEPVVWYYQHDIMDRVPSVVWDNYSKLFPGVWVASAFKGATGSAQILTNASVHLDNNLQWVSIIRKFGIQTKKITFRGIILTGWQRYDHFATLCELLPVGLPSLALCLKALKVGAFGPNEMEGAQHVLSCSNPLDLEFPALTKDGAVVSQDCGFPASDIFYATQQLWGIMEVYRQDRGLQERISGWMTDYHIRQGISNPGQMKVLAHKLSKVIQKLHELAEPMRNSLLKVFDKFTVDEWIATNIQDRANHIKGLYNQAIKFLNSKAWPARPFVEPTGETMGMKSQPVPGQMSKQSVSQNVPGQGPQVVGGRLQIHSGGGVNAAQNNGRLGQQDMRPVQKQMSGSANYVDPQGRVLSNTFLRSNQNMPGRPMGPGKMPNADQDVLRHIPQNKPVISSVNSQFARNQRQENLGQYVPGLPSTQNQNPSAQGLYRVNQNRQGLVANQYNQFQSQQNQGLAQNFPNQQVQRPHDTGGFGQPPQGLLMNQKEVARNSQAEPVQGGTKQQGLPIVQGPSKVESRPVNFLQMPAVKDQGEGRGNERPLSNTNRELNKEEKRDPSLQLPAGGNGFPSDRNEGLKKADMNDNGQKETRFLDSFVGRRGFKKNDLNNDFAEDIEKDNDRIDKMKKGQIDYDAEDDEITA